MTSLSIYSGEINAFVSVVFRENTLDFTIRWLFLPCQTLLLARPIAVYSKLSGMADIKIYMYF